jgi:hypothetical protein
MGWQYVFPASSLYFDRDAGLSAATILTNL